ncbi:LamG-like jellyroll fold domain-containing protein, partial [Lacticaseibacillus paracasei]
MNVVLNAYWTGQEGVVETVGAKMVMNQWVHLAVVRHGNTITSYVNGVVNVTRVATAMGSINDSGGQLEMGATMGGY